jgi:hypothetical protein
MYEW